MPRETSPRHAAAPAPAPVGTRDGLPAARPSAAEGTAGLARLRRTAHLTLVGRSAAEILSSIPWDGLPAAAGRRVAPSGSGADRSPLASARRFFATFAWEGGSRRPAAGGGELSGSSAATEPPSEPARDPRPASPTREVA